MGWNSNGIAGRNRRIGRNTAFPSQRQRRHFSMKMHELSLTLITPMKRIALYSWAWARNCDFLLFVIAIEKIRIPFESSQPVRQIALSGMNTRALEMRNTYDFSKSKKNPYSSKLKKQITIRLDEDTIAYFKALAEQKGIPYQSLINLYLRDCAEQSRDLKIKWAWGT